MGKYRKINTELNRQYRNDLNHNFDQIDEDIKSTKNEIKRVEIETKETIDGIVGGGFIEGLETARDNANAAANNANSKATYADGRGKYANAQGDYAKEQGDYAKLKGDYANDKAILADEAAANANAEATNLDGLKVDVVDATQSANTAASNAVNATANAVQATTDAQTATSAANTATKKANNAADLANEKAELAQTRVDELNDLDTSINESVDNAEIATNAANNAADNANSKASLADEKAQLADTAALNADEKAQLAEGAATLANEKANLAQTATDEANERIETMDELIPQVEGLENKGAYDSTVDYVKNNIVRHNGSSYQALKDNVGVPVTNADTWSLAAQRGVDGEGAVSSVNGVSPEEDGDVTLTAEDVGAETPTGAQEKANTALSQAKQYADDLEPDLTGYATESYVDDAISEIPDVDLSPYAPKVDLQIHVKQKASEDEFGHVKVDGKTIVSNGGVISAPSLNTKSDWFYYYGNYNLDIIESFLGYRWGGAPESAWNIGDKYLELILINSRGRSAYQSSPMINLDKYDVIKFELEGYLNSADSSIRLVAKSTSYGSIINTTGQAVTIINDSNIERGIYELDVSSLTGDYYVNLLAAKDDVDGEEISVKCYRIWGE